MAGPMICPQGHPWQPDGSEAPTPANCPICGEALHPSHADFAATLDYQPPPPSSPDPIERTDRAFAEAATIPSPDADAASASVLSQRVPGYDLLGELGRGGMGVVYRARQAKLNRIVALKMILAGASADEQQLRRFRAEAESVARLQHPSIVQIHEIGEHEGCPFFSLEYVDGGTLAQKLNGVPQPPRLAAHLIRLLAQAIHSAHQKGIIHRDLKPGNILLATPAEHISSLDSFHGESQAALRLYGIPKITDFGLAKHLDVQSQTRTGAIVGTPSYMAPEQAEGRARAIGPATDVYALGAILYEMLTGRPPFHGDSTLTTIRQVLMQDPLRPSQLQAKVPRDLETICLKCLEKDPARRYASAEELAEDLDRFLRSEPIEARPVGWWGRSVKWTRRHPTRTALIAAVMVASLALLVLGLVYHFRVEHAREEAQRSAEENKRNLIRLHVTQGTTAMNSGDGFTALLWFTEALRLDPGTDEHERPHRQRISALLHGLPKLAQVWVHEDAVNIAQYSPDGRRVLTAGDDGKVHIWDTETGESAAAPLTHAGPVLRAVFSPDGKRIATASRDRTARIWDAATGKPLTPPLKHNAAVRWIEFSPDGRRVATAARVARVWDAASGKAMSGELKHTGSVYCVLFSPGDGRWLATAGADGLVRLWGAETLEPHAAPMLHDGPVLHLAFSPDGRMLASASADRTAHVWDTYTGAPIGPRYRHSGQVTRVAFGPFNLRLLTASDDGAACLWRISDGERLVEPLRHRSAVRSIAFSPDGCRVATGGDDNTARVWSATTGTPLTPPLRFNGTLNHVAFSPDGRRLAGASDDGTVRVWRVACRHRAMVLDEAAAFHRRADRSLHLSAADRADAPIDTRPSASPNGRYIIKISDDNTARVCDAHTGAAISPPLAHRNTITYAAFSPDSRRVITTSADQTAQVWDAASGERLGPPLRHASTIEFADFSPDGQRVATSSTDNTARIWSIPEGAMLLPPLRHDGTVTRVLFSPHGQRLATASLDQTARVWDSATGQPLTPPLVHPWTVRQVRFSADGQRLLTTGPAGDLWSWDLPSSPEPIDRLISLSELLSGRRIDPGRGLMPLRPDELRSLWDSLRQARGDLFHPTPADVLAWHRQTIEECARGRYWKPTLWHLDRLVQLEPDNWLHYARRGRVRAELGLWTEAGADFAEVVKRAPAEPEGWCLYGLLRLYAGDAGGYRRACAALREAQEKKDDPRTAYVTAWTCVLSEDAGVKAGYLVELAVKSVAREARDPEYLCTLGAALYRAGDLESAARRLNEALVLRGRQPGAREWLWLALVRHRMGLTIEARQWLDKAKQSLDAKDGQAGADAASQSWVQRLQLALLRREVERVLMGTDSPKNR